MATARALAETNADPRPAVAQQCREWTTSGGGVPLYENIVIGNFLFGLGIKIGARQDEMFTPGFALHLMQQTPLDIYIGDVLFAGPEGGRSTGVQADEADKRSKERGKLAALNATPRGRYLRGAAGHIPTYSFLRRNRRFSGARLFTGSALP